ncbi:MAG: DNA topoisomerase [Eubacterium sp.]|nr:DNA topoisomerase [Eubacterium sp.]
MSKRLFIAEKPSVAKEFARVMGVSGASRDGYMESNDTIVTWCVGHLVTMSYPEIYDPAMKNWNEATLPFLPETYLYEVIPSVKKQFDIVSGLLNRDDVDTIYVCTDSGREGEYIYRLVDAQAHVPDTKKKLRVWIDSQTEEEIRRGVEEAKPLSAYDALSDSAYLRAKHDYLMGINFSRILSIRYGKWMNDRLTEKKWTSVSVGRVMTCVLGMVVVREWEIRRFVKTPFYRVQGKFDLDGKTFSGEWRVREGSHYYEPDIYVITADNADEGESDKKKEKNKEPQPDFSLSHILYKENGFREEIHAKALADSLGETGVIESVQKKQEKKNPPLLFNLAELQNLSSKLFKISPDETLQIVQDLYEKKLVTYPRTDARVLSTAVAKEIGKNLNGLMSYPLAIPYLKYISENKSHQGLEKTRYVNDKKITDHYAIIPTGSAVNTLGSLSELHQKMYEVIVRRFLSIFYPPAVYQRLSVCIACACGEDTERFFTGAKVLVEDGFLPVNQFSFTKPRDEAKGKSTSDQEDGSDDDSEEEEGENADLREVIDQIKKGTTVALTGHEIKEGETSPPKRYNSGSIILAMENAGQLIEDEELRAQIKGSGIGTSATRAEILKKLFNIGYLSLNKKTQIITPSLKGELVYGIVYYSMPAMLSPKMTANWEKGLTQVADGEIQDGVYMDKLNAYVTTMVDHAKKGNNTGKLQSFYSNVSVYYNNKKGKSTKSKGGAKK